MIRAYFEYDPVGNSAFALEKEDGELQTTYCKIEKPADLVSVIATFVQTHGVNQLVCNKAGIGLAPSIREYLLKQFNYSTCEIIENAR